MLDIEAFRKQLINANPKTASLTREEILSEDLIIAYEALDRITDSLGELIDETNDTDKLVYYAQLRGELCSCLLYTSPSPRDGLLSRMPSSA